MDSLNGHPLADVILLVVDTVSAILYFQCLCE